MNTCNLSGFRNSSPRPVHIQHFFRNLPACKPGANQRHTKPLLLHKLRCTAVPKLRVVEILVSKYNLLLHSNDFVHGVQKRRTDPHGRRASF